MILRSAHRDFWEEHPALLWSLSLLIGTSAFLFWEPPWNLLFPSLWGLYLLFLRRWPLLLLIGAGGLYSWLLYANAPQLAEPKELAARFSISSLQPHASPFEKGLVYRGTLHLADCAIPCAVFYRGKQPPKASCDYLLTGKLSQRGPYQYTFKAREWHPLANTWSLAVLRYRAKEQLRQFLEKKLPSSSSFLSSLLSGDVEDRLLRYEFGRLGLQHILAISGSHFAVLISFASFFLGLFLPRFWKLLALIAAINAYFFFVGSNPAVQRSWLTALLYLSGQLFHRNGSGLNLLGFSLLVEITSDPLTATDLGFQLSFLSCGGILLFFSLFEKQLRPFLPQRSRSEIAALTPLSRHGYLLSSPLRQALSLTCAVNLAIAPVLLYHFHTFPLLSLFYNLFFPFLVGIALFPLLLAFAFHFLFPPIASLLFLLTDLFTSRLLDLVSYPPFALDYSLRLSALPAWVLPFYLFGLLALFIHLRLRPDLTNRG